MRRTLVRVGRQMHHLRLAFRLVGCGADLRSKLVLFLLAAGAGIKQNTRWRSTMVAADVLLAGRRFTVAFAGRTDLEVLREIAAGEYALPASCRPRTILDLGAHIGLAALYLHAVRPDARILCVEADPNLLPQLRRNVEPHGINVLHAAVAATSEPTTFFVGAASWGNSLTRQQPDQRPVQVAGLTYAEVEDRVGEPVDLLKIDVEGAEWAVFAGGAPAVRHIIGETHARGDEHSRGALHPLEGTMRVTLVREDPLRSVFWAERTDPGPVPAGT